MAATEITLAASCKSLNLCVCVGGVIQRERERETVSREAKGPAYTGTYACMEGGRKRAFSVQQGFLLNLGCQFLGWARRQHTPDSAADFRGHLVSWGLPSILRSSWLYNKHYWPLNNLCSPNTVYTKLSHLRPGDLWSLPSISPMRYWNYRFAYYYAWLFIWILGTQTLVLLSLCRRSFAPESSL